MHSLVVLAGFMYAFGFRFYIWLLCFSTVAVSKLYCCFLSPSLIMVGRPVSSHLILHEPSGMERSVRCLYSMCRMECCFERILRVGGVLCFLPLDLSL